MSEFEFILVTIAIIAGFAISEILAGWGRSLLRSGGARYSGLRFFASLAVLFLTVRYVWTLWSLRSIEWQFGNFVLVLTVVVGLALAAHVISLPGDPAERDSNQDYFARARPFFVLLVAVMILWTLYELANLPAIESDLPSATSVFALRAVGVGVFLWLAYTRRPSHHWIGLGGLIAALVYLSLQSLPALPQ